MAGTSRSAIFHFVLLAVLVVVCALHAVQASEVASGTVLVSTLPSVRARRLLSHRTLVVSIYQDLPGTSAGTGGLSQGRTLKTITITCGEVDSQCPKGGWWLCGEGPAKGVCRAKSEGRFPRADCKYQCYIET